ncbi:MAG: hypothetical protein U0235_13050 [Polyangiaceae bacterium]
MALRTLFSVLLAASVGALGCASASSTEQDSTEGALGGPGTFEFHAASAKEKAGEIDVTNAYWTARFADYVYTWNDERGIRGNLDPVGLKPAEVIPLHADASWNILQARATTGTDAVYLRTNEAGFLIFRGSEDGEIDDAIADVRFIQLKAGSSANHSGDGGVHAGFLNATESIWGKIHDVLKARHGDGKLPLYIVGHSLGGGLGAVALHHLLYDGCLANKNAPPSACESSYIPVTAMYTFGSPRVGDETFVTNLVRRAKQTGTRIFRFVNEQDRVSMLPRYSPAAVVSPYRHLGEGGDERELAIFLDYQGKMFTKPSSRCTVNAKLVQCDPTLGELMGGARPWKIEHSRRLYIEKLEAILKNRPPFLEDIRREVNGAPAAVPDDIQ